VYTEYPVYAKVISLVNRFKKLISDKNALELAYWIEAAKRLEIREIDSFTNGLLKDLDTVKN
jgi:transposase